MPERDDSDGSKRAEIGADELFEQLEPFEPYTTDELAEAVDADRGVVRTLLEKLSRERSVKRKKPKSSPTIWIREPTPNSCSKCGRTFEIRLMHPVFSSAQFCPQCGNRL